MSPRAKYEAQGVSVELEATEVSITELNDLAKKGLHETLEAVKPRLGLGFARHDLELE